MGEDNTDKAQQWEGGFEPLDLPADLHGKVVKGPPPIEGSPSGKFIPLNASPVPQEEAKSATDMEFDAAYIALQKSVERGDADGYVRGLGELGQAMKEEVIQEHGAPKFGDLHHTFMEWQAHSPYLTRSEEDSIKTGADVDKVSNTLDNQFKPHRDWDYHDRTMRINSESFGKTVADYLNQRGKGFITGSVVLGNSLDRQSEFVVQTVFKGFPKAPVAK